MFGGNDSNLFSFDKLFENMPFVKHPMLSSNSMQKYVQDVLKRSMPQMDSLFPSAQPKADVFETHRSVIVRVHLPAKQKPESVRVRHNASQVKIEGLVGDQSMNVRLPAIVSTRKSRCRILDGILEIRLVKRLSQGEERDLSVEY